MRQFTLFQNLICHTYSTSQFSLVIFQVLTPQPYVANRNYAGQHGFRRTNKRKEENKGNKEKVRRKGHPTFHDHFTSKMCSLFH